MTEGSPWTIRDTFIKACSTFTSIKVLLLQLLDPGMLVGPKWQDGLAQEHRRKSPSGDELEIPDLVVVHKRGTRLFMHSHFHCFDTWAQGLEYHPLVQVALKLKVL